MNIEPLHLPTQGKLGIAQPDHSTCYWTAETLGGAATLLVEVSLPMKHYEIRHPNGYRIAYTEADPERSRLIRLRTATGEVDEHVRLQRNILGMQTALLLDGEKLKLEMELQGNLRVWGNDSVRVMHRDFQSFASYTCKPGYELAALLATFVVFSGKVAVTNQRAGRGKLL